MVFLLSRGFVQVYGGEKRGIVVDFVHLALTYQVVEMALEYDYRYGT